ncbi:MAG: N-acetylmuramoyl-L-alanine amidase [Bacteroidetes bacterium]|nr:N-acetylmuramoyl-L-alanine amidase [Bacteroidota bacterium]
MRCPLLAVPVVQRWATACLAVILCCAGMGAVVTAQPATVERISFAEAGGQTFVMRVHLNEPLMAYQAPERTEEGALRWTLFNAALSDSFDQPAAIGPISWYQIEQANGHLHMDLHLNDPDAYTVVAYRDRGTPHVLMRVARTDAVPAASPTERAVATDRSEDADAAPQVPAVPVGAEDRPSPAEASARWRLDTVVIDAGHGGRDPGAVGYNGIREKDVVLATAKQLGQYIEERLEGVSVIYTRSDDTFIELADRGKLANRAGGKLFISIHANSARAGSARGAETYILGTHRSEQARRVMELENSVIRFEQDTKQYEAFDQSDLIMQTLTHSAYLRNSERLASLIQDQFSERVQRRSRGVKQAGFYVLWGASMPAVLVELGFISNPDEARFLASERGQTYMASAIFRAVRDYKEQYEKGLFVRN